MIAIIKKDDYLLLEYEARNGVGWIENYFASDGECRIQRTFFFKSEDIFRKEEEQDLSDSEMLSDSKINFILGKNYGSIPYFKIDKRKLNIQFDVYFQITMKICESHFIIDNNISIFRKLNEISKVDLFIGDTENATISISTFHDLVNALPTSHELKLYVESRVSTILRNEIETAIDAKAKYEKYMNTKTSKKGDDLLAIFGLTELEKYRMILDKLKGMLSNQVEYNEKQWQYEILQIVQLMYPKYIHVFSEVTIRDVYSGKKRRLDYLLVDSNGNVDIIEIKRPFNECILSSAKYRDNFIPMRELSGSVMQIEKYIFWLNKWGRAAEKELLEKYKDDLPNDFELKIINPSAIIIIGREIGFTDEQKSDFEIIKRKYTNVIDVITYDELVKRIEIIISKFSAKC